MFIIYICIKTSEFPNYDENISVQYSRVFFLYQCWWYEPRSFTSLQILVELHTFKLQMNNDELSIKQRQIEKGCRQTDRRTYKQKRHIGRQANRKLEREEGRDIEKKSPL